MNIDEFAFTNQQLAGMLKSGIPLEGALHQMCATMQRGQLRSELEKLHADLAQGVPLRQAIASRELPEFYVRMMQIGAQSNDLTGMLTLLADYYQRRNFLWSKLKGLLVYPGIVLLINLALTIFLAWMLGMLTSTLFSGFWFVNPQIGWVNVLLFVPVIVVSLLTILFFLSIGVSAIRNRLRWRVAGFREASLSHFASSLQLLLQQGTNLTDALTLLQQLESSTPLGQEIRRWQICLAAGRVKSADLASGSKIIPPLFFWIMAGDEENWIAGLGRASEIYYARALHKIELLLYAALPVSILVLGVMIIFEIYPVISMVLRMMMNFDEGFGS